VTAPPDPIADGTTSDVPIHSEKTNILFHPTPSITYQPMFEELEKRATSLTVGIVIGVVLLGKMFGGSLWGLIPLAFCLGSGVYLWMKEVVRSGRDVEWSNEQLRGETVWTSIASDGHAPAALTTCLGHGQSSSRISGMVECIFGRHLGPPEP
jgi:Ca2+-dependent lipid-binding protein